MVDGGVGIGRRAWTTTKKEPLLASPSLSLRSLRPPSLSLSLSPSAYLPHTLFLRSLPPLPVGFGIPLLLLLLLLLLQLQLLLPRNFSCYYTTKSNDYQVRLDYDYDYDYYDYDYDC